MIPHKNECIEILLEMLNIPLGSGDAVFEKFASLKNAQYFRGENKQERFLYIKGTRKDRVLLVAHADTYWDEAYGNNPGEQHIINEWPVLKGCNDTVGIGADDRAGCAMLYALKDSGHSLLIMDAEEKNKISHEFLKKNYPQYLKEFNKHSYMIEIDLPGGNYCSSARIENTKKFVDYIKKGVNVKMNCEMGVLGTDITQICESICGINLSCGYYNQHKENEFMNGEEWCTALYYLNKFLEKPQKRFKINKLNIMLKKIKRKIKVCY